MIHELLVWGVIAASLFQPNISRFIPALIYSAALGFHYLFMNDISGLPYYGSAALVDLAVLCFIGGFFINSNISLILCKICAISIVLNFIGWLMWMMYIKPDLYNLAYYALYSWVIIVLLQRDRVDAGVGSYTLGGWIFGIRSSDYSRLHIFN